jgi:hypothetical protein
MLKPKTKRPRRSQAIVAAVVPPVVAAVVQPVAKRLSRIEALLLEMRFEQDVQAKRVNALKVQLELLTERRTPQRQRARPDEKSQPQRVTAGPVPPPFH